jgi:hypothetical protein
VDRPTEQVETWWSWVTGRALLARSGDRDRARAQRDAGLPPEQVEPVRTLDQCRSDVLADLGDHGLRHDRLPTRHGREPHLQVVVAASTLLGADDEPAELVGAGPVTAPVARRIAGDGVWRRLLTDPVGQLLDVSVDTYEPPQWMRDLVVARDRTCQGPGCRMPAARCDLDHTVEWPCGPTCPANLCALCRTHHRVKTLTDASCRAITGDPMAAHRWTLPSGHTYAIRREPALDHPALVHVTPWESTGGPAARGDPCADSDPPDDYDDLPPF